MPALGALAPGDALRYYAQALDLYPQVADRDPVLGIDLAIGLGTRSTTNRGPRLERNAPHCGSPGCRSR